MKLINVATKVAGMHLLAVGEAMIWVPEAGTLQTDGKHLHSSAKSIGIKIAIVKSVLAVPDQVTKTVFYVERIA